jgi:Zn finger protein HypA/HybF involved in hydrogenase expression
MKTMPMDMNTALMLDGNAVGGLLNEIFSIEMTTSPTQCAHCCARMELGSLIAFMHGTGVVLRCPACESVIMRIVQSPQFTYLDLRGATFLRLERVVR